MREKNSKHMQKTELCMVVVNRAAERHNSMKVASNCLSLSDCTKRLIEIVGELASENTKQRQHESWGHFS